MTNNFVGLNLLNLQDAIFEKNYVLKFFRNGSNQHIIRLENQKGKLIACEIGIGLIPTLEKLNKYCDDNLCYKDVLSNTFINTNLDRFIIKGGGKLTIKKNEIYIRGIVKTWEDNTKLIKQSAHLIHLLTNIERELQYLNF